MKTVVSELKGKVEILRNLSGKAGFVIAAPDYLYCMVEDSGLNNTNVAIEPINPKIFIDDSHLQIPLLKNGTGERINLIRVELREYCDALIAKLNNTIQFMEERSVDLNLD